jgi:hypothetical protein
MRVPVSPPNDPFELTREHLEEMWENANDMLQDIGLQVKQNIVLIKGKKRGSILNPNFQYLCM